MWQSKTLLSNNKERTKKNGGVRFTCRSSNHYTGVSAVGDVHTDPEMTMKWHFQTSKTAKYKSKEVYRNTRVVSHRQQFSKKLFHTQQGFHESNDFFFAPNSYFYGFIIPFLFFRFSIPMHFQIALLCRFTRGGRIESPPKETHIEILIRFHRTPLSSHKWNCIRHSFPCN